MWLLSLYAFHLLLDDLSTGSELVSSDLHAVMGHCAIARSQLRSLQAVVMQ